MSDKLAWGILSSGRIAHTFARGLASSQTGRLVAVGSRTQESAEQFGEEFAVPHRHGSYEALLADPDVQAVYIAPPHPMHAEWAIKAAEAGKHILCEKPLGLNHPEAMAIFDAARRNNVFLMEAFMYRCHPQTATLVELIREGVIGAVRMIQATFSFHAGYNPESRLYSRALGGGGILDVGCYSTSMARLLAGAATGQPFAEPLELKAVGHLGESGVDNYTAAVALFPGDIVAQVATGIAVNQESVVRVFGAEGSILVPSPWFCNRGSDGPNIIVQRYGEEKPQEIFVKAHGDLYGIEADTVAAAVAQGALQASSPAMSWDDTLGNLRMLDSWRLAIGLQYDGEKPEDDCPTADRQPLAVRSGHQTAYGQIAGVEKPVSRLVIGTMMEGAQHLMPHAAMLYDEFFRNGGTCFDTAYVYHGGTSERILGRWIRNRDVREQVVVLGKGAHTPCCNPTDLTRQLLESLDRLQTDYLDIYMMHRDNPEIPVGEFIDVLNEHLRAGRIRAFGGSNWTVERVAAANAYAQAKGLVGFAAVSNNFSLARMVDPVWGGGVASSDAASRAWFAQTQMPLMSWSSQARGFFVRGDRNFTGDAELARCWYSDDNFQRLDRVRELARRYGVSPINIALAYVLHQPFPTYALIGPRTLEELHGCFTAASLALSPEEVQWLNLEIDAVPAVRA